ncbi:Uncharacterized protein TCM_045189 [Theobroma cacao]|uniref:Uncharacterized protein n=1 Tax=Theobroma cacao TaxID=3641 RepID=A0A061FYF4_THECC|nr:Uncharacterized protein TCM_045189 [Theobroma cacao]
MMMTTKVQIFFSYQWDFQPCCSSWLGDFSSMQVAKLFADRLMCFSVFCIVLAWCSLLGALCWFLLTSLDFFARCSMPVSVRTVGFFVELVAKQKIKGTPWADPCRRECCHMTPLTFPLLVLTSCCKFFLLPSFELFLAFWRIS